jgi:hypothetical protein
MFRIKKTHAKGFHRRQKPVTALSPVTRVQRSISMFRKNCVTTPSTQAQKKTKPVL